MKKIYIVLTYSGSLLSRTIKLVKKYEYTHVSISLDKELTKMYSFGRLYPYNAFIAGFVQESPHYGTFKRFSKTTTKILSLDITDEQYKKLKKMIKYFNRKRKNYKFNTLGLFSAAIHLKIEQENKFYCAEFIKYLLEECKIETELPDLITPEHFLYLKNTYPVYSGKLQEYQ